MPGPSWRMVMPIDRFISAGMRRQRQSLSSCFSVNRSSSLHLLVVRLFTFSRGPRGSVASSSSSESRSIRWWWGKTRLHRLLRYLTPSKDHHLQTSCHPSLLALKVNCTKKQSTTSKKLQEQKQLRSALCISSACAGHARACAYAIFSCQGDESFDMRPQAPKRITNPAVKICRKTWLPTWRN